MARGRSSIYRALGIDGASPAAFYAGYPFRIIETEDGHWIGGAVGCPNLKEIDRAFDWSPLDVAYLILWNPRTNDCRVMGETKSFLLCPVPDAKVTVYGDPLAFFRAWAARRARYADTPTEMPDSDLPGALLLGSPGRVQWHELHCEHIFAGPGVVAEDIKRAVFKQARLPQIGTYNG